jgi:flavin-dependent dehydrogenase
MGRSLSNLGGGVVRKEYDAIIVGASFAGLAVARRLKGEVLLVDRNEVGAVQTSACGTPLWVPRELGVAESILQVHDRLVLRMPDRTIIYDLSDVPFCTFDYERFCRGLLAQCRVRFLRAAVTGMEDGEVRTSDGRFQSPVIVDCSGWRRALANGGTTRPAGGAYSFGLETLTDLRGEGLNLWLDERVIPGGMGWAFPVGEGSLIGLGSYAGHSKLKPYLERFLGELAARATTYHGAYLPSRLLGPTVGTVFAVGDAAGQCLPLTAEGIRPALYFGGECGAIIQGVIEGRLSLAEGLARYRRIVGSYRWAYRWLRRAQWLASHAPPRWFTALAEWLSSPPVKPHWWPRYGLFGRFENASVIKAN